MLKDITAIESKLADEMPANLIEIAGLFVYYK